MDYIYSLRELVSEQVGKYITDVMREEKDNAYSTRSELLRQKSPLSESSSEKSSSTALIGNSNGLDTNNNPLYPSNMVDRLNTPFDHIDRILLQDFSDVLGLSDTSTGENYFVSQFGFSYGTGDDMDVTGISLNKEYAQQLNPEILLTDRHYLVESFTYTPFIDFATKDSKVGIYSDEGLTKFNTEGYNVASEFVDVNRRSISENMYELRNLEQDIYDAKIAWRDAVSNSDKKVSIHTFCEHLLGLFARLSNIRMCHEVYGLRTPHSQWEGILALDIWYQLLYLNIDAMYPFNEDYLGRNPMTKLKIETDGQGQYVDYFGTKVRGTSGSFTWFDSEDDGYALIWDNAVWNLFNQNSRNIASGRQNYVTPRGVLNVMYGLVNAGMSSIKSSILEHGTGDFNWFYQPGKVYSDSSKSAFSRYTNLHLGRAYDVMEAREYHELWGSSTDAVTQYIKPAIEDTTRTYNLENRFVPMLSRGVLALQDAFNVILSERQFNIYNSSTKNVEVFNPSNAASYSQSQCAIVIERVFSRLYMYLNFKSTTSENIQHRVNIDSGYKYLTTNSILGSDSSLTQAYYDESDSVPYLRYMNKLEQDYINGSRSDVLDEDEREVLSGCIDILKSRARDWNLDNWDICPFCVQPASRDALNMAASPRSASGLSRLHVDMNFSSFMTVPAVERPGTFTWSGNVATFSFTEDDTSADLSTLDVFSPTFTHQGKTIQFRLLGYSTSRGSRDVVYSADGSIYASDYDDTEMTLYAVWEQQYIVVFQKGSVSSVTGDMSSSTMVVQDGVAFSLPRCGFTSSETKRQFTYHEGSSWNKVENTDENQGESRNLVKFSNWTFQTQNGYATASDGQSVVLRNDSSTMAYPVVAFVAEWKTLYQTIRFMIGDECYCESLIDTGTYELVHPKVKPTMSSADKMFVGWSRPNGTVIAYNGSSSEFIVCGDDGEPIVCGDGSDPIVCQEETLVEYDGVVTARISDVDSSKFSVTFRYIDNDDALVATVDSVDENHPIPTFHIHQTIDLGGGASKVFRYWKLTSGNLTSRMHVMSDVVLCAVYDVIQTPDREVVDVPSESTVFQPITQTDPQEVTCEYASTKTNRGGRRYCMFTGAFPRTTDADGNTLYDSRNVYVSCPKIVQQMVKSSEKNDFSELTMLDIQDVDNLVTALLKVNMDIAHREKFIKVCVQEDYGWWYGYVLGLTSSYPIICENPDNSEFQTICDASAQYIVCTPYTGGVLRYISFEPVVEYKFSNLHADNQTGSNGKLPCTFSDDGEYSFSITPVNRELLDDLGIHFSDNLYAYDYFEHSLKSSVQVKDGEDSTITLSTSLNDQQKYYSVNKLCLYEDSVIQSPTNVNGFVKHRLSEIGRRNDQVQTFTSIVKRYRPIVVPNVRDIFNDCANDYTKYEVDVNNTYGIFGWCTIPSKTMVDMEYNEQSIIVPSTYDHHNRVGGSSFLQLDRDFDSIYNVKGTQNIMNTWYYLYNERDWTYFMNPVFSVGRNNDLYKTMTETYETKYIPSSSDHINGIIYEPTNEGRNTDADFGDNIRTCMFLASHHHGEMYLRTLADDSDGLVSYQGLVQDTASEDGSQMNYVFGSSYVGLSDSFRSLTEKDVVDDYDRTSSYVGEMCSKYTYNLGQRDAIDDGDEDSVWMYITMVEPIEEQEQVVEIQDIMPFVFWWSNRGEKNNGPTVDCYGRQGSSRRNYDRGGYCYESPVEHAVQDLDESGNWVDTDKTIDESRWHAVQHTLGVDFSDPNYGGAILTYDNSGNVYKGAFDPTCAGTDEKWKIHADNAFGSDQHMDISADKYLNGPTSTHDDGGSSDIPSSMNDTVLASLEGHPMMWNLWNCVRHYCYIRYFRNQNRTISSVDAWQELENYTKGLVRGIYRTFAESCGETFGTVDGSLSKDGGVCAIRWTNSFAEIESIMERNAREHEASLVMFTGNSTYDFNSIKDSRDNFVLNTLDGFDADEDGMRPRRSSADGNWVADDTLTGTRFTVYQGHKYAELPYSYVVGDNLTYSQMSADVDVPLSPALNLDTEYPYSEYQKGSDVEKWVRSIQSTIVNRQIIPLYTTMNLIVDAGGNMVQASRLTVEQMRGITFQVVPQMYWKYEWCYNDFMIHPVGRLNSTGETPVYDMLGNVWEWVRDDWSEDISSLNGRTNPMNGDATTAAKTKTIRGGAFDQFCRKTISASREGLSTDKNQSESGTQANVGFRPSMTYTFDSPSSGNVEPGTTPVDLFFLFDASASQDSQITQMVASANEIVKKFAGSSSDKSICNVGSALFMGPCIKMVCCAKQGEYTDRVYITRHYPTDSMSEYLAGLATYDIAIPGKTPYEKWDGNMVSEFNKYRNQYWSSDIGQRSGIMVDTDGSEPGVSAPVSPKLAARDAGSIGGGSNTSGGDFTHYNYQYPVAHFTNRYAYFYRGMFAWKDDSGNLCYSSASDSSATADTSTVLFNYDPSDSAHFECPFIQTKKGVLSNWWSGCESISTTIRKLLVDGLFTFGYDIGYMFRKNVPKLILVFSNEYDNEYTRETSKSGTIYESIAIPGLSKDGVLQFERGVVESNYSDAVDPFCLYYANTATDIHTYLKRIGIESDATKTYSDYVSSFKSTYLASDVPLLKYAISDSDIGRNVQAWRYDNGGSPTFPSSITSFNGMNGDGISTGNIGWANVQKYLTAEQINQLTGNYRFPHLYDYKIGSNSYKFYYPTKFDQLAAKPLSFYSLNYALKGYGSDANTNVFIFPSDAAIQGLPVGSGSPYLLADDELVFKRLFDVVLPETIRPSVENVVKAYLRQADTYSLSNATSKNKTAYGLTATGQATWKTLFLLNLAYYGGSTAYGTDDTSYSGHICSKYRGMFGDRFTNPYTKNNVIFGYRGNWRNINHRNFVVRFPLDGIFTGDAKVAEYVKTYPDRVCSFSDWVNNKDNVRRKLTRDDCEIVLVQYFNVGGSEITTMEEFRENLANITGWNNKDTFKLSSFASIKSSRYVKMSSSSKWTFEELYGDEDNQLTFNYDYNNSVDYTTIEHKDASGNVTGRTIIIGLIRDADEDAKDSNTSSQNVRAIINYIGNEFPAKVNEYMNQYAGYMLKIDYGISTKSGAFSYKNGKTANTNFWNDATTQTFISDFYASLKNAAPVLMSYRYYAEMFSQLSNAISTLDDYDNEDNTLVGKAIPVMSSDYVDAANISNKFVNALNSSSNLNAGGSSFGETHCVIDLLDSFKAEFTSVDNVNVDDYKTSKIVLERVAAFSGDQTSTFTMGSKSTDYDEIEDMQTLIEMDGSADPSASSDNKATVTLMNGGSFQKNEAFYEILDENGKEKYKKNRHFFIDPFELTIAQWCYVHGWNTKELARTNLGSKLDEMAYSYLREQRIYEGNTTADETDESQIASYNPLVDTRPYYYATYDEVRGENTVYSVPASNTLTSYGDDYQMTSRSGTSFMDLLNANVKMNTKARTYVAESDGGETCTFAEAESLVSGKSAGLNFDLPTEAQWEYCCRQGVDTAFPTYDLGDYFQTNHPGLDLIAWYKYRDIGRLPEPERFCAWRISRLIFGMTKDKAQLNNVYEKKT